MCYQTPAYLVADQADKAGSLPPDVRNQFVNAGLLNGPIQPPPAPAPAAPAAAAPAPAPGQNPQRAPAVEQQTQYRRRSKGTGLTIPVTRTGPAAGPGLRSGPPGAGINIPS